ncbi:MAG: HAMP domain-containing protein [Desulfobacteraceae bacterium]|nr:MAG: HAMP domain-containing protein [Desulfobacteraceae bacterium]
MTDTAPEHTASPEDEVWVQVGKYFGPRTGMVQSLSNLAGACFITVYFTFLDDVPKTRFNLIEDALISVILFLFLVLVGWVLYRRWYRDIAVYIKCKIRHRDIDAVLERRAQKKVLNVPVATSAVSMFNWTLAAVIVTVMNVLEPYEGIQDADLVMYSVKLFAGIIFGGLITSATIFFIMESFCRRHLHHFFPQGGLLQVKGVFRLNLRLRIMLTFVFASFIPITDVALVTYEKARMITVADPQEVLSSLGTIICFALLIDLSLAFLLSHLLAKIIVAPVTEMKEAMTRVERGDLHASVRVSDNNELGILGNHFNRMTEGLRDRYQIKKSLAMAREVQQDLLPRKSPDIEGLDIAGNIIYSDETGGDYFDYISPLNPQTPEIGVVVGDVSDHGIPSAILMASTRAFIRQRAALGGDLSTLVNDVNFQFTRDVEDSGRFMTLFFLSIDLTHETLTWVRAGHDAAMIYDPVLDTFDELKGEGVALGVEGEFQFNEYSRQGFGKGQVILMATDGLWEAVNHDGEMFGKQRILQMIRRNAHQSAQKIKRVILDRVQAFSRADVPEDDITLVVIKRT